MGAAIPLVISAVGAYASYSNTKNTAKKQDNQLASQIRMQQQKQREADARTHQFIDAQGKLTDAPQKSAEQRQIQTVLAANAGRSTNALNVPGAVSSAYERAGSDAALGVAHYGKQQGDLISSMDAPFAARRENQKAINDYSIDLSQLGRSLKGDNYLARLKYGAIQPNPWLTAFSSLASGAARGMASNYGGGQDFNNSGDLGPSSMDDWSMPINPTQPDMRKVYA